MHQLRCQFFIARQNDPGKMVAPPISITRAPAGMDTCARVGPQLARVPPVHYPLTYEKLAAYNFNANAAYLYALELLPELAGN